jgi:hypothetical protein
MSERFVLLSRLTFWLAWIIATAASGAMGWLITVAVGFGTMGIGMLGFGLIVGALVGAAQGGILLWYVRRYVEDKAFLFFGWVFTTIVGMYLCLLAIIFVAAITDLGGRVVSDSVDSTAYNLFRFSYGGAAYGLTQWIILRCFLSGTAWWILATSIGWALGATISLAMGIDIAANILGTREFYAGIIMGPREFLLQLVEGSLGTAIFGLVTATALVFLLRPTSATTQVIVARSEP